jgi:hypothetical protein
LAALGIDALVDLHLPQRHSALLELGWFESYRTKEAIDREGQPIPWCTYPFIRFVEPRLRRSFRVFEYGCGNSTVWYAGRVRQVVAVEHNEEWLNRIGPRLPENAEIILRSLGDGYVQAAGESASYDIVAIDGLERAECARPALGALAPSGVIVWDNSDRIDFRRSLDFLAGYGFRELDFSGMSPINTYLCRTSVLYRADNCLGI